MQVTQAVQKRSSIRAFTDQPVSNGLIRELIEGASRAPSGGNVQPWQLYVFNGDAMVRFKQHVRENPRRETPGYAIYPENLKEPHRFRDSLKIFNISAHPRAFSVLSTSRWVHPSGLIWACFSKLSCC